MTRVGSSMLLASLGMLMDECTGGRRCCDSLPKSGLVSRGAAMGRKLFYQPIDKCMLDWRYKVLLQLTRLDGLRTSRGSPSRDSSAGVLSLARR